MPDAPAADFDWLALTKLAPPARRPDLIPRPRLFDTLHQALATCPLTLVSAPAGSGKTTLLADWLNQITDFRLLITTTSKAICNLQSTICNHSRWGGSASTRMTTTQYASLVALVPR